MFFITHQSSSSWITSCKLHLHHLRESIICLLIQLKGEISEEIVASFIKIIGFYVLKFKYLIYTS
jgi:hypothetical protein